MRVRGEDEDVSKVRMRGRVLVVRVLGLLGMDATGRRDWMAEDPGLRIFADAERVYQVVAAGRWGTKYEVLLRTAHR